MTNARFSKNETLEEEVSVRAFNSAVMTMKKINPRTAPCHTTLRFSFSILRKNTRKRIANASKKRSPMSMKGPISCKSRVLNKYAVALVAITAAKSIWAERTVMNATFLAAFRI